MNSLVSRFAQFVVRTLLLFACASSLALAQAPQRPEPVLGVGDVVKITVYQNPDLATEARLSENGQINFPLIGNVTIGGLSVAQAQARIEKMLRDGGFVLKPQVTIQTTLIKSSQIS
ncbi:MAG TPA: polysaccharide biosynthesis/export family protein, partial [Caldimonas sp.]